MSLLKYHMTQINFSELLCNNIKQKILKSDSSRLLISKNYTILENNEHEHQLRDLNVSWKTLVIELITTLWRKKIM